LAVVAAVKKYASIYRLRDSEMIDDEARVGVAVDQRSARVDIARE
jgi:hypothetical protein